VRKDKVGPNIIFYSRSFFTSGLDISLANKCRLDYVPDYDIDEFFNLVALFECYTLFSAYFLT
jgi:hypothetical protein